jgi:hypothetical protein
MGLYKNYQFCFSIDADRLMGQSTPHYARIHPFPPCTWTSQAVWPRSWSAPNSCSLTSVDLKMQRYSIITVLSPSIGAQRSSWSIRYQISDTQLWLDSTERSGLSWLSLRAGRSEWAKPHLSTIKDGGQNYSFQNSIWSGFVDSPALRSYRSHRFHPKQPPS